MRTIRPVLSLRASVAGRVGRICLGLSGAALTGSLWIVEVRANEQDIGAPAARTDAGNAGLPAALHGGGTESDALAADETPTSCMDWQSPAVDIIEGRFLEYGSIPNVRYAMGQIDMGLGIVRTTIELSWRNESGFHAQTLFDTTTTGHFAGGISFYRADDYLNAEYLQCGWDDRGCTPYQLRYRFDIEQQLFVGEDSASRDALFHICKPVYFDSERALRRARP